MLDFVYKSNRSGALRRLSERRGLLFSGSSSMVGGTCIRDDNEGNLHAARLNFLASLAPALTFRLVLPVCVIRDSELSSAVALPLVCVPLCVGGGT